jgi:integrase/recombinase XerD
MYQAKAKRKYGRNVISDAVRPIVERISLFEVFERFMAQKRTEGLAIKTLEDYEVHFGDLIGYLGGDIDLDQVTADLFRGYIDWMLHDRGLAVSTVNVRIRTMRAFVRYAYSEGHLTLPVHEEIKLLKTEEDTIESFTSSEVKSLLSVIDTSTIAGFRDYVMVCTLLDTMVRISELIANRR